MATVGFKGLIEELSLSTVLDAVNYTCNGPSRSREM